MSDLLNQTAQQRYESLTAKREPYLDRARKAAKYTIPSLYPEEGANESTDFETPWQSTGAKGVNSLAAKLMIALLPPSQPFFRFTVDDMAMKQVIEQDREVEVEIQEILSRTERTISEELEVAAIRHYAFDIFRHLVVSGNALMHIEDDGRVKVFHLGNYVVRRNPEGEATEIIVQEYAHPSELPAEVVEQVKQTQGQSWKEGEDIELYTRLLLQDNRWQVSQEASGIPIPGAEATYPKDRMPWVPLRFSCISGEDYGRGYVEEYIGDLIVLENLSKSITEAAAAAAKVVFLLKPGSVLTEEDLVNAENLAVLVGDEDDVSTVGVEKFYDFRTAKDLINDVNVRLREAFLMHKSIQRDAERVTAEEIRFMANELDDTLSGVYSVLSQEFQMPLVRILFGILKKAKRIPQLPEKLVKPIIVTGLAALGRNHDLLRLDEFFNGLPPAIAEEVKKYVDLSPYLKKRAACLRLDIDGFIKSRQEVEQAMQAEQMQAMAAKLGPEAIRSGTNLQMNQQPTPETPEGNTTE